MTHPRAIALLGCLVGALLASPAGTHAQSLEFDDEGFLIASPEDLIPPEGERGINLVGDPSEPGLYVVQLTWPPGTGSRPHYHNNARHIEVLKGTWYVATGAAADIYDPDSMIPVEEGSFIYQPPEGHHYDMAKDEEVVVKIWGLGPVVTTRIPQPGDFARE